MTQSPKSVTIIKSVISRISSFLFFETDLKVIFLFKPKLFIKVIPVEKTFAIKELIPREVSPKRITKSRIVFNPPIAANQNSWLFFSFFSRFFMVEFLDFLR